MLRLERSAIARAPSADPGRLQGPHTFPLVRSLQTNTDLTAGLFFRISGKSCLRGSQATFRWATASRRPSSRRSSCVGSPPTRPMDPVANSAMYSINALISPRPFLLCGVELLFEFGALTSHRPHLTDLICDVVHLAGDDRIPPNPR